MKDWTITIISNFNNDIKGALTLLFSIKKYTNIRNINIVLPNDKTNSSNEVFDLCEKLELNYKKIIFDENLSKLIKSNCNQQTELKHIPNFVLAKIFVPILTNYEKTIYLDTDVVFTRYFNTKDIKKTNKKIYAINNGSHDPEYWFKQYSEIFKDIIETSEKAFNAGVIFFNETNEKDYNVIHQKSISLLKGKRFNYLDQEILNFLYKDNVEYIDLKFNFPVHNSYREIIKREKSPVILHFASKEKPWNEINIEPWRIEAEKYHLVWKKIYKEFKNFQKN